MCTEILLGLLEVVAHRLSRGLGVARPDGLEDRLVLLDDVVDAPSARAVTGEAPLAALAQRLREGFDQEDEHAVAGGRSEVLVEADVGRMERLELGTGGAHGVDRHLHVRNVAAGRAPGSE
jgi:hypothetical protein